MKFFIVLASVCALGSAQFLAGPQFYAGAPGLVAAPAATSSQFHAQDETGSYQYGYAGGPSSKTESKTPDGITRGSYSYIDANGIVQTTNYISDPVNGFRVQSSNLPAGPAPLAPAPIHHAPIAHHAPIVHAIPAGAPLPPADTPEVQAAKAQHFAAHAEARARAHH